ncbi:hypothetical protein HZU73_04562 [Apis mellifera caucasica]|uniref:Uncharacterized protein LOC725359 n=1 Tax=Apis mellifera TaxID=7460 RepID=A0A7M7M0G9_APIME|nr:uncharacterized protein LOC725359 [Apis mellifera]KAG6800281.1 hypothetical protein HZU73_04562 [Apis mellifera caucasica]KAG9433298.1 hypothetical protein HZU67_05267 [Apis mellifera carnica]|eukprot:XP_016766963.1 uncharacterized protein LOC725359 [Apis mellifera]
MIKDVLINYIQYPIALTAETTYVDWQIPFPAIAFCITSTPKLKRYFILNPGSFTDAPRKAFKYSSEELLSFYEETRIPCKEFFAECSWNNIKFDCCTKFQELRKTGVGYCLAINTFHLKKFDKSNVHFFVNRTVKYGDLIIDISVDARMKQHLYNGFTVYFLNNLQLPIFKSLSHVILKIGHITRVGFTMEDTFNEDGVKKIAIEHRGCRFPDEKRAYNLFDIYSRDSCYVEVIIERMIKLCGCVNFYYFVPQGIRVCNSTEMSCIYANKMSFNMQSLMDECVPDCEGTSLAVEQLLESYKYDPLGEKYTRLQFTLLSHPMIRYRRYVVNDLLNVTVSVGSAIGLFMGASILSIFEIPYWLFIRRDKIK